MSNDDYSSASAEANNVAAQAARAMKASEWNEALGLYRRASNLYLESGHVKDASLTLEECARAMHRALPNEAILLCKEACGVLEDNNMEADASKLCFDFAMTYTTYKEYKTAASFFLRGTMSGRIHGKALYNAYLTATLLYLAANEPTQAKKCCRYNTGLQLHAATRLVAAYVDRNFDEFLAVAQSDAVIDLDGQFSGLAKDLASRFDEWWL